MNVNIIGDAGVIANVPHNTMWHNSNNNMPLDGMIRLNGSYYEYLDIANNCWRPLDNTNITISLDPAISNWIHTKMAEEAAMQLLEEKVPAVKKAREQYETIVTLAKESKDI